MLFEKIYDLVLLVFENWLSYEALKSESVREHLSYLNPRQQVSKGPMGRGGWRAALEADGIRWKVYTIGEIG